MKYLDKIANVAVIVGVVVFLVLVMRNEFGRPSYRDSGPKNLLGKRIELRELKFPLQRNSLVLTLSTTCHFCQDSLPFYKTLATQVQGKADLVAVFPQADSEGRAYTEHASLPVRKVISADLSTIGVFGTPTVLLIDRNGKDTGSLERSSEQEGAGSTGRCCFESLRQIDLPPAFVHVRIRQVSSAPSPV